MVELMNARALLLIHGYPFDHSLWDKVRPCLDPNAIAIVPDLPGFGIRPVLTAEPSLDAMADDLRAQLSMQGVDRAVVAGMSMGGYVALALAERCPHMVAGLALVSSQTAADTDEARANRRSMIGKVRQNGPLVAAEAAIPKMFSPRNAGLIDLIQFPRSGAEKAGAEGIAWALEAMARRPDRTALFEALSVPALVLHGADDQLISAEKAQSLAQRAKHCRYVPVSGAGHATPLENPELVAQALNDLLDRSFRGQFGTAASSR
jgi:pimeloyl-ACP methyl ester carboxylesterase